MRDADVPTLFEHDDHHLDSNLFPKLFLQATPVPGREGGRESSPRTIQCLGHRWGGFGTGHVNSLQCSLPTSMLVSRKLFRPMFWIQAIACGTARNGLGSREPSQVNSFVPGFQGLLAVNVPSFSRVVGWRFGSGGVHRGIRCPGERTTTCVNLRCRNHISDFSTE